MSGPVGSSTWFGEPGYEIGQSLRFNDDDGAFLQRTPSSAGNLRTWTWSAWVKRGELGASTATRAILFEAVENATNLFQFGFIDDEIHIYDIHGSTDYGTQTTSFFRDVSAWYHIVLVWDTTLADGGDDRVRLYVNGTFHQLVDEWGVFPQNYDGNINAAVPHALAKYTDQSLTSDIYLAEVNFIDGLALPAHYFGTTGTYGEWIPIEYTGAYGTNGFYLSFADGGIMSATGGNSTATDGDFKAASFTSNGTFTPSVDGYVECLIVAGGGGGGFDRAAGGGAGGYIRGYLPVTGGTGYSITVGAGGAGATSYAQGTSGSNSVFSTITSLGGGGAAKANATAGQIGLAGGSGGGGSGQGTTTPGAGTAGQGNAGGAGSGGTAFPPGGGGGAGAVGGTGVGSQSGVGGVGLASSITGSSVYRAGGGGAGSSDVATTAAPGAGGNGGGGAGGVATNGATGTSGTANTGGGGGGGAQQSGSGGSGGSGVVIIRYKFQ